MVKKIFKLSFLCFAVIGVLGCSEDNSIENNYKQKKINTEAAALMIIESDEDNKNKTTSHSTKEK